MSDPDVEAAVTRLRTAGASLVAVSGHDSTPYTHDAHPQPTGRAVAAGTGAGLPIDPVCRMAVDPWHSAGRLTHEGVEYCLCSLGCAGAFAQHPATYAAGDETG